MYPDSALGERETANVLASQSATTSVRHADQRMGPVSTMHETGTSESFLAPAPKGRDNRASNSTLSPVTKDLLDSVMIPGMVREWIAQNVNPEAN